LVTDHFLSNRYLSPIISPESAQGSQRGSDRFKTP